MSGFISRLHSFCMQIACIVRATASVLHAVCEVSSSLVKMRLENRKNRV